MSIICTPEVGIPFPTDTSPEHFEGFRERAHALFTTLKTILPPDQKIEITPEEKKLSHELIQKQQIPPGAKLTSGVIMNLEAVLNEYDHEIIGVSNKIRNYVINKLIEESTHANDKHRIKAIELLGKLSSVAVFSDNVNVNVTHRTVENIEDELRKTLRLYGKDVTDVDVLENVSATRNISLDDELGPETPPDGY